MQQYQFHFKAIEPQAIALQQPVIINATSHRFTHKYTVKSIFPALWRDVAHTAVVINTYEYEGLVGKTVGKKPPGRPRYTWAYNVKIDFKKLDGKPCVWFMQFRIETSARLLWAGNEPSHCIKYTKLSLHEELLPSQCSKELVIYLSNSSSNNNNNPCTFTCIQK